MVFLSTLLGAVLFAQEAAQDVPTVEVLQGRILKLESRIATLERILAGVVGKKEIQEAQVKDCGNNLRQMWTLQHVYMSQFGGRMKSMPTDTGSAFWLTLAKTKPPLLEHGDRDILVCPLSKGKPLVGLTNYRGPRVRVASLKGEDPVGCCEPGCHPDGTISVLLKSGEVKCVRPDDPIYKRAMETTSLSSEATPDKDR